MFHGRSQGAISGLAFFKRFPLDDEGGILHGSVQVFICLYLHGQDGVVARHAAGPGGHGAGDAVAQHPGVGS